MYISQINLIGDLLEVEISKGKTLILYLQYCILELHLDNCFIEIFYTGTGTINGKDKLMPSVRQFWGYPAGSQVYKSELQCGYWHQKCTSGSYKHQLVIKTAKVEKVFREYMWSENDHRLLFRDIEEVRRKRKDPQKIEKDKSKREKMVS